MPISTDRLSDSEISKLSPSSQTLIKLRDRIEKKWAEKARQNLKSAAHLDTPILIETFPGYLENIAESLTPNYPRAHATERTTLAQEHGGERARLTSFDLDQLIAEYHLLKETIFEVMESEIKLSAEDKSVIELSIDMGIREAVTAFTLVQNNIREQFIATLTHDVRQPLNTISMAAQMLPEEPAEDGFDARTMILNAVRKADALIQDLLDATLIKTGQRLQLKIEECDMRQIINECVREHALDQKARFEVQGESVTGYWSPRELERAIDNLIMNAIKYGDLSQPIRIHLAEYAGRVMVSIHNAGKPIPVDEQESIFQAFRRAQAVQNGDRKGWGLGLPLVRGIVEAHAGNVHVDSAEGRGTSFVIDMPKDVRPYQNAPVLH